MIHRYIRFHIYYIFMELIFPGWLFKLELNDAKELDNLMSEKQYEKFLETESSE